MYSYMHTHTCVCVWVCVGVCLFVSVWVCNTCEHRCIYESILYLQFCALMLETVVMATENCVD